MTSSDRIIYVEIDGVQYMAEGLVLRPAGHDERLGRIEQRLDVIEHRLDTLSAGLQRNTDRLDWVQTTVYWGFALIAFIVGAVPLLQRKNGTSEHGGLSYRDVKDIIKAELRDRTEGE